MKTKALLIQRSWCKGCGICVAFCPKKVLELDQEAKVYMAKPDACIYCKQCELRCPDLVFEIQDAEAAAETGCSCSRPAESGIKA